MRELFQPPRLVIFDCDGVLVNSEPIFNRVLHEFLRSVGAELSFQDCCDHFTGKSRHEVEQYLVDRNLNFQEDWSEAFYRDALDALRHEVEPIPGVHSALRTLWNSEVICCVASNSLMKKMEVTLERTGMLHWFSGNIYSAYDVGASKPAPDVFLHAAKANKVRPEDCVVIEDSPSGFEAAAKASMNCFAYVPTGGKQPKELHGANTFSDMAVLPAILGI
ncbi:HAD family hydrolase [Labrenzia sp. CE80]|uniref:HAD family hydrolase n=1 Tax=Labrenzia sp. CE80 TaxID=1788986 RepID=UPI00129B573D|nr:HAD family hydrolase [Labrenzia sp. CE80]